MHAIDALPTRTDLYERALLGEPCWIRSADGGVRRLPVEQWIGRLDSDHAFDAAVVRLCDGPTIDLGCGPGRFVSALLRRGVPALGVDNSTLAVRMTLSRGGTALHRDIFGHLPGAGRWHRVLLVDGNIGIGADTGRLLRRVRSLLDPDGSAIIEFERPGVGHRVATIRLETEHDAGPWFSWARVGIEHAGDLARDAGLTVVRTVHSGRRHLAIVRRR